MWRAEGSCLRQIWEGSSELSLKDQEWKWNSPRASCAIGTVKSKGPETRRACGAHRMTMDHVCAHVCACVCACACMCVRMCVYMHAHTHICVS